MSPVSLVFHTVVTVRIGLKTLLATCSHYCCVFRPANGCSARRSLVEIKFFNAKTTFCIIFCGNDDNRVCQRVARALGNLEQGVDW